jgi:integrase
MPIFEIADPTDNGPAEPSQPQPRLGPQTLADLSAAIAGNQDILAPKRGQIQSSLKSFARMLGRPLGDIAASAPTIRAAFAALHPRTARISPKRLDNIRADLQWALRTCRGNGTACRTPPDEAAMAVLERVDDRLLRIGLSRFVRFVCSRGIPIDEVDDSHVDAFRTWLEEDQLCKDPKRAAHHAVTCWNRATLCVPGWPRRHLGRNAIRVPYCLKWEALPSSLRNDAEAWLRRLEHADPTDLDAPARPLRPASLKARRFSLLQAISGMVHSAVALADLHTLADVVQPERAALAVRFLRDRAGGRATAQTATVAGLLLLIARHWVNAPAEQLRRLTRLKTTATPTQNGMTTRNRALLQQFDSEVNVAALLLLPERLFAEVNTRQPLSRSNALALQSALMIDLLLMVPVRRGNLAGLRLDQHLLRQQDGRRVSWSLVIPPEEVKNAEPIEATLASETGRRLDIYLRHARPVLSKIPSPWLFPGADPAAPKCADALLRQVQKLIRDRIGLKVTLHFFRSLSGFLFLSERPGEYETVRRVLAHKRLETTVRHYLGAEAKAAIRRFDATVLELRDRLRER